MNRKVKRFLAIFAAVVVGDVVTTAIVYAVTEK